MKRLTCWVLKTPIHSDVHFALGKVYRQAIGVRLIALLLLCKASRALRKSVTESRLRAISLHPDPLDGTLQVVFVAARALDYLLVVYARLRRAQRTPGLISSR